MYDVREMKYILQKSSNKPLIVIAAGNEAKVDAAWSGYPILAAELPDQVIAVGAVSGVAADYASLWPSSAINSRSSPFPAEHHDPIQIYAPGENVAVLAEGRFSGWAITTENGTSVAAPMVAGVAGLLKSFDPSLTSKDIKNILIAGAEKGGRLVVGGGDGARGYVVNAYESLKLAAQRPGAPLCGNRVWVPGSDPHVRGGAAVVERGDGQQELFSFGTWKGPLDVMHGGGMRLMYLQEFSWQPPAASRAFTYSQGGWLETALASKNSFLPASGGAFLAAHGYSHDRDMSVRIIVESGASIHEPAYSTERSYHVDLGNRYGYFQRLGTVTVPASRSIGPEECVNQWIGTGGCASTWGMRTERDTRVFATLAPAGDHLFLTVSRFSMTQTTENAQWRECYPANRCLNYLQVRKNEGSDVYAFTNQNGKWERRLLLSDPVAHLEVNGTSEDGRQLIVRKRTYTHTDYWLNGAGPGDVVDNCTSRYYDSTSGVLLKEVPSCFATTAP